MKDLVNRHFGIEMMTYESVTGKGKDQISFDQVDIEKALPYAAADADFTFQLKELFEPLLPANPRLTSVDRSKMDVRPKKMVKKVADPR